MATPSRVWRAVWCSLVNLPQATAPTRTTHERVQALEVWRYRGVTADRRVPATANQRGSHLVLIGDA